MAEFKGTKGKWGIFSETTNSYGVEHSNVGTNLEGVFIEVYTEEHQANALLISKAPEMLELIKEMVSEFSIYKNAHGTSKCGLIFKAEELIEKATEL